MRRGGSGRFGGPAWSVRLVLLSGLLLAACSSEGPAGDRVHPTMDSGGPLPYEQAAYDVTFYDLALAVDPGARAIEGVLTAHADVVQPLDVFVLDLDGALAVRGVEVAGEGARPFVRRGGQLRVDLGGTRQPGARLAVRVEYGGRPRSAPRPPWEGGFTWAETAAGEPWIATSVQGEGADLWWPCKDHPSDEPDSFAVRVTVPRGLVAASNGRLRSVTQEEERTTYEWFVSTPINNYGVALAVAPYEVLETDYESVDGVEVPVRFYVLPERAAEARRLLPEVLDHLAFFESILGPYPWRADKYGVAHTPFLGMEHQTLTAYGSTFEHGPGGFDGLHHHELAHEWWGNLVTASDWRDFWLHEGLATYMQALYAESRLGPEAFRRETAAYRAALRNERPVAPRASQSTRSIYFDDAGAGPDLYAKGAAVLHALRYLLGDEAFFETLRRFAYPTPALAASTDGRAARFASTDDFVATAEAVSGRELGWFFEVYLRRAPLPRLARTRVDGSVRLAWEAPDGLPFPMPVDVVVDGRPVRVEVPEGGAVVRGAVEAVDPGGWVLRAD